jgi:ATP-dependent Clp protease ATP-binding subunit ClpA
MYERFTIRARKVMQLANQEAQRFDHEYIGTEHIWLGLIKEGSGVAANVLKNLDVDLRKIHLEVEKLMQSGPDSVAMGKLPQTPRAKKAIEHSIEEAGLMNHDYVGTEHLLLGLLREPESPARLTLLNSGITLEDVRQEVLNLLGHGIRETAENARLRLQNRDVPDVPESLRQVITEYEGEIRRCISEKEEAIAEQDFERATRKRDRTEELKLRMKQIFADWIVNHPVDSWLASSERAVAKLAWKINDGRRWDELPSLADALEAAGCTDREILAHCRAKAEHTSQCWVVDLLLAKVDSAP